MGQWVPSHKGIFPWVALGMMSLSLVFALREKKKTGSNKGLVVFALALVVSVTLILYTVVKEGFVPL